VNDQAHSAQAGTSLDRTFSIAPMMDWTDRHCRYLHRQLTKRALLFTEMVTSPAVLHGPRDRLLGFDAVEHPVAVQLGGSDPVELAEATRIAAAYGYDEVNLNVGCPSDRVQSGRFGACLMAEPELVAECVRAMRGATDLPVTVKCRLGIDEQDIEAPLDHFVDRVIEAGADHIYVHARKAWLKGLSPKENRTIPPLDYDRVHRLARRLDPYAISINGGIATLDQADEELGHVSGVMLGRAAYHEPALLADIDHRFFGDPKAEFDLAAVMRAMTEYAERELSAGTRLNAITRHMLGLANGRAGARHFRQVLSVEAARRGAGPGVLEDALACLDVPSAA
jgi:tRNA-dihydrouridine synthase A